MEIDRDWCKKWQCNFCNAPGQFLKKVDMEGLQFAQQQFYKVHFLLASKISLFISEGKKTKYGTLGQTQKTQVFKQAIFMNIVLIVDTLDN